MVWKNVILFFIYLSIFLKILTLMFFCQHIRPKMNEKKKKASVQARNKEPI